MIRKAVECRLAECDLGGVISPGQTRAKLKVHGETVLMHPECAIRWKTHHAEFVRLMQVWDECRAHALFN